MQPPGFFGSPSGWIRPDGSIDPNGVRANLPRVYLLNLADGDSGWLRVGEFVTASVVGNLADGDSDWLRVGEFAKSPAVGGFRVRQNKGPRPDGSVAARFQWFDALEVAQGELAELAAAALRELVGGKGQFFGYCEEKDIHGRYLVDLCVEAEGTIVGLPEYLVSRGMVVVYHGLRPLNDPLRIATSKKLPGMSTPRAARLMELETIARENKFGIWAHDFVPPHEYRQHGKRTWQAMFASHRARPAA